MKLLERLQSPSFKQEHLVLDLETKDPFLVDKGSDAHCRRHDSYVFMAQIYYPETDEALILKWDQGTRQLIKSLLDRGQHWYGANIKYDLNWLLSYEVMNEEHTFNNVFHDVNNYAVLLDETQLPQFYSLDGQCRHYGLPTKPIDMLVQAAKDVGISISKPSDVLSELYRLPWAIVAEYGEHDVRATWAVFSKQKPLLDEEKLTVPKKGAVISVVDLEDKVLPILCLMERRGVRIDVEATQKLKDSIQPKIDAILETLRNLNNGHPVNINPSNSLTQFLLDRGHVLPETEASKPEKRRYSTSEAVIRQCAETDPAIADIIIARKAHKIGSDFCGALLEYQHNGRVHANINQLYARKAGSEDESQGVRFGRFSYTNPNLQQIPKRDTVTFDDTGGLGTAMRNLFIAEEGCQFLSADFSSQEPRWIIHWAETWGITGGKMMGDKYRENPSISSHDIVAEKLDIPSLPTIKEKKPIAKIINLGKGYEMGKAKLIRNLVSVGADPAQADEILKMYEREFPHVSGSSREAMRTAEELGYVRTYTGRKLRFNVWEPINGKGASLPYNEAYETYCIKRRLPIKRAATYRAFNRIVQGSSADQTKYAMVVLWYEHRILPTMQIHDELTAADIDCIEKAYIYKNVMETCTPLTIPSVTEVKLGPTWAKGELINV